MKTELKTKQNCNHHNLRVAPPHEVPHRDVSHPPRQSRL